MYRRIPKVTPPLGFSRQRRPFVLLNLPAFLSSVISSFLPKIGGGGVSWSPRAPRSGAISTFCQPLSAPGF